MGSVEVPVSVDIDAILLKLTLEEKISLLAAKDWWRTPVIKRDNVFVPHIKMTDGPNGARGESYVSGIRAACFPCATSLGSTFNTDLLFRLGVELGKEVSSKSANVLLAPTLNVIRSPLGGRNYETYSEDPLVLGLLAAAFVNGCQSTGIAATPKHFVANEAENRRVYLTAEIDEQTLREIYLYPFQLVMTHSSPLCFMTSYNRVNGTYAADDSRLLEDILRKEWGFQGLVMSDWMGTYSTAKGLNAGVDLEMPGPSRWRGKKLLEAIENQTVSEDTISKSARRVLELARCLGRFEQPGELTEVEREDQERDDFIRDAASEGMVLLKNENNVLPIPKHANIVLIGHLAKVVSLGGGGSARVNPLHARTPLQGFERLGLKYTFQPGVPVFGALPHAEPAIVSRSDTSFVNPEGKLVKLEWFNGSEIGVQLVHEEMVPNAEYMIKEAWPAYLDANYCTRMTFTVTPKTSGNHILSVISTGPALCYIDGTRVFVRDQETDLKPESFYMFKSKLERRFTHAMKAGQKYCLRLEAWATDPNILNKPPLNGMMFQGSSLRFFEEIDIDGAIAAAATAAKDSDYAVVCVGTTNEIESEGYDRDTMDLVCSQYDLIAAVAAQNKNTIVVNFSGAPVTLTQTIDQVPAIIQAWFPGQECGDSVAQILTGIINPSGRLPLSWPKQVSDNSSYGNFPVDENDVLRYEEGLDVGYRHYDRSQTAEPLFPFGFGLSYTTFDIFDVKASAAEISPGKNGKIVIYCQARNTGLKLGKFAVQLYVSMPATDIGRLRPVKELKAFAKVELEAGETKLVEFTLNKNSISFYDADNACWRAESGVYTAHVGQSSKDIPLQVGFSLLASFTWTGV